MLVVSYTRWRSLYDIDDPKPVTQPWPEFVETFSTHARLAKKEDSAGFGPYTLKPPTQPCARHRRGLPRSAPHRCDVCIAGLTLAVFDVDVGTESDVERCSAALGGITHLWYTTYSHRPERHALRLVLPLATPVPPEAWAHVRSRLIARYSIPSRLDQCSGVSHYYHAPSAPLDVAPDAEPFTVANEGVVYDPAPDVRVATLLPVRRAKEIVRHEWPDEPADSAADSATPIDLTPYRERLERRLRKIRGRGDDRAEPFARLIAGDALAQRGARTTTTRDVTWLLAYSLPMNTPRSVYAALLRPSVQAMIADGSSMTMDRAFELLERALEKRAAFEQDRAEKDEEWSDAMSDAIERVRAEAKTK